MIVKELIWLYTGDIYTTENVLSEISIGSKTAKLCVDCLVRSVFLIMLYVQADQESHWALHLYPILKMLQYFFLCWSPTSCSTI